MLSFSSEPVVVKKAAPKKEEPKEVRRRSGRVGRFVLRWVRRLLARYSMVVVPVEDLAGIGQALDHVMTSQAVRGPFHGVKQERLINSRKRVEFWCGRSIQKIVALLEKPA